MRRKWLLCCGVVLCVGAICCGFAVRHEDDLVALRPYVESDRIEYDEAGWFEVLPGVSKWGRETVKVRAVTVHNIDPSIVQDILVDRIKKEGGWYAPWASKNYLVDTAFQFPTTFFLARRGVPASGVVPLGKAIMAQSDPGLDERFVIYETMPEAPWEKALRWVKGLI